jgi:hypothetical protein
MGKVSIDDKASIEIIRLGKQSEFWKLLLQALEKSIKKLEADRDGEDLKELPNDQYKVENELIKAKIQYLKKLMETPDSIVSWLQDPDNSSVEFDPYEKPEK